MFEKITTINFRKSCSCKLNLNARRQKNNMKTIHTPSKMSFKIIELITLIVIAETFCLITINADSIDGTTDLGNKMVNKLVPIIIKTPERNFDEPSLADFERCSRDYDSCKQSCESLLNAAKDCLEKCPKCPVLVIQNRVIQGINDTDYRALFKPKVVNTTNIISLTNQIHNIIDNNLGITARNENNIHLHTKNLTVGGRFGYGYTEEGPCCMVMSGRDRKQRLCGQRCKAPIMHARPIVQCNNELDIESCRQVIEYKPYRRSKHMSSSTYNRCSYQQEWPFVFCRNRRQHQYCSQRCLELAYSYILQYGVPLHCVNCFKNFDKSSIYLPPSWSENDESMEQDDWTLEKTKCRNSDGTITDDCITDGPTVSNDGEFIFPDDEMHTRIDERDNNLNKAAFDSFQSLDTPRKRRNTFRRSKYSRRNSSRN